MSALLLLFVSAPAVGADIFLGDSDCFDRIVKAVVTERGEVKLLANSIEHLLILFSLGVKVYVVNNKLFACERLLLKDFLHLGVGEKQLCLSAFEVGKEDTVVIGRENVIVRIPQIAVPVAGTEIVDSAEIKRDRLFRLHRNGCKCSVISAKLVSAYVNDAAYIFFTVEIVEYNTLIIYHSFHNKPYIFDLYILLS